MGFIGGLLGLDSGNSGSAGMNYQASGPQNYQMADAWANSQYGLANQKAFLEAMAGQNALGNQSGVFGQQQQLANQLQAQAMGAGPNPAQAQFQQNANQIAAQQAGLMGAQKGISPALQARMIAQQGAGAQQAVAGQAATLQAQQQLQAQQSLMQQQANMANLSTQQVGQQQAANSAYMQGALGQQQNVYGLQGNTNTANAGVSGVTAGNQGKMFGGIMNAISGGVTHMAEGGMVQMPNAPDNSPTSNVGRFLYQGAIPQSAPIIQPLPSGYNDYQSAPKAPGVDAGQGMGTVMGGGAGDAPLISAAPVMLAARGGMIQGENYAHNMKPVPGKAKVGGDSEKNDTVPAKLSPGEIIIPRSIAMSPNAPEMAARFVAAVRAKQGRGLG